MDEIQVNKIIKEVKEAFERGETIQYQKIGDSKWIDLYEKAKDIIWDTTNFKWRIKPKEINLYAIGIYSKKKKHLDTIIFNEILSYDEMNELKEMLASQYKTSISNIFENYSKI